jgi:hypothetical protein
MIDPGLASLIGAGITGTIAVAAIVTNYLTNRDRIAADTARERAATQYGRRADAYVRIATALSRMATVVEKTYPVLDRGEDIPDWPATEALEEADALTVVWGSEAIKSLLQRLASLRRRSSSMRTYCGPSGNTTWRTSAPRPWSSIRRSRPPGMSSAPYIARSGTRSARRSPKGHLPW